MHSKRCVKGPNRLRVRAQIHNGQDCQRHIRLKIFHRFKRDSIEESISTGVYVRSSLRSHTTTSPGTNKLLLTSTVMVEI